MTDFIARKLTPEKEQAKREQIAKEDALVEKADMWAYGQFGFAVNDKEMIDVVRTIVRIRKHMTTYDVFGHKFIEEGMSVTEHTLDLPDTPPTDADIISPPNRPIEPVFQITWRLSDIENTDECSYTVMWQTNMYEPYGGTWLVKTPMGVYPIETGDVYDDMDCVYGTIVGSYMCENKMFQWQKE